MGTGGSAARTRRLREEARYRGIGAGARDCTTRRHKTPLIDVGRVCYPFHPWYGRPVHVLARATRYGVPTCDCRLDTEPIRALEIPAWMLDPAACAGMALTAEPRVALAALVRLRQLLDTRDPGPCEDDQHPVAPGRGADDAARPAHPTDCRPDRGAHDPTDLGAPAGTDPTRSDPVVGADVPGSRRPKTARPSRARRRS